MPMPQPRIDLLWNDARKDNREEAAETVRLLEEAERVHARGLPVFRHAALLRESAAKMFQVPHDVLWCTDLLDNPRFQQMLHGDGGGFTSLMMSWSGIRLQHVSDVANWFRLSEGIAYKFLATDLRGAVCGDITLPMQAFYIELPPGMLYLQSDTGAWHESRSMLVTRGEVTQQTLDRLSSQGLSGGNEALTMLGSRLVVECFGQPHAQSIDVLDDLWSYATFRYSNDAEPIEALIQRLESDTAYSQKTTGHTQKGRIGDRTYVGAELFKVFLRLVLNLCVYLGSEKAKVEPLHAEEIKTLRGNKKWKALRKNVQDRIKRLENDKVFVVGSDVAVTDEFKEYVRTEGTEGFRLTYRTLVRGHWRNQAHGPGRTLRVRKWIEPHVRGASLPTKVVGHNYEIG